MIFIFWLIISLAACSLNECDSDTSSQNGSSPSRSCSFSIANWNVQTFFDGVTEGSEYSDFKSAAKWSNSKYYTRLKRLCEVLAHLNADVFVADFLDGDRLEMRNFVTCSFILELTVKCVSAELEAAERK